MARGEELPMAKEAMEEDTTEEATSAADTVEDTGEHLVDIVVHSAGRPHRRLGQERSKWRATESLLQVGWSNSEKGKVF